MNLHEYQARDLLASVGIPIPAGCVVSDAKAAGEALKRLQLDAAVVKAQVHAGGRGKAGGVKVARNAAEVVQEAARMLGAPLVTAQTGSQGVPVNQVLLSQLVDIDHEYYLGATVDRRQGQAVILASPAGGVDIEEVAAKTPDKLMTVPIRFDGVVKPYHQLRIVRHMGWSGDLAKQGMAIIAAMAKLFMQTDALLLEINPLVKTKQGQLIAIDAKLSIDENALYRQPALAAMDDITQIPVQEAEAKKSQLAYVALEGNIGCMVNGAGLAMATMDLIQYYHGKPANFLDVGGGASEDKVAEGFKLILSDPQVKAILVNIFGGIMNCATLAGGIIAAAAQLGITVPLVVRMEGNNVEAGRLMLDESGLNLIVANDLADAAQKVVAAARQTGAS